MDFYLRFQKLKKDQTTLSYNELHDSIEAWATNYYIPEFENELGNIALRDIKGNRLGPKLSSQDWCISALEGSVKINFKDGTSKVYNFDGSSSKFSVDCSPYLNLDLGDTKFKISNSEFGEGAAAYNLVPFRSVATDNSTFPLGTVLYIPSARGNKVKIGDKELIHDGYFFVADSGGAIKDNHIDVFTGVSHTTEFFPWVGHKLDSTFKVFIVNDTKIIKINEIKKPHLLWMGFY